MNILLTGGAGFIGSQIVDAYIEAGHHVSVIDNLSTGFRENVNPQAELFQIDIRDRDGVEKVFRSRRFDLLNHHAAQLDVRVSVRDPQFDAGQNVIGTLNLFQGALQHGVGQIVFASSGGAVYGEQESFPATESHPTNPISPYGITKLTAEKYLHYYRHEHGIEHLIFRYTNVYGPRQNQHGEAGVISIFFERMLSGQAPVIYGSGEQTRDYVYVGDLVRANLMALEYLRENHSDIFNLCTGVETSVNDLFRTLNGFFQGRFHEEHAPARKGEQVRSVCSWDHAAAALGWRPEVGFPEGVERTLAYYGSLGK